MKAFGRLLALSLMLSSLTPGSAQEDSLQPGCSPILIFASDTQEPMRIEEFLLRSNDNKRATEALFKDILAHKPTELFLLGDVVNLGYKDNRWNFIDTALMLAHQRGFNVQAILGNHELMGRPGPGERNFQSRFPGHVRTGYMVVKDSIAVILLNSNFSKLSKEDVNRQDEWYTRTLAEADSMPEVHSIIVCCHHSPYSNSKMVGSSTKVQEHFVTPYLISRKTALFISGHAHIYQHFMNADKHFFVIGGGGGLHHPLGRSAGPHVCLEPDYDPLFHFLTVQMCNGALKVISHRLKDDFSGFDEGCDYLIDVPSP